MQMRKTREHGLAVRVCHAITIENSKTASSTIKVFPFQSIFDFDLVDIRISEYGFRLKINCRGFEKIAFKYAKNYASLKSG